MTRSTKILTAISLIAIAVCVLFFATNAKADTPVHLDFALSFSQSEHMHERLQSENDVWPNVGFYCGTLIRFDIENLKKEDFDRMSKAGEPVAHLMQMNPANMGWLPTKIDKDDGLRKAIFRAYTKQLEHVWPISKAANHLDVWKYGRKEAERRSAVVRAWLGYLYNLWFINGEINGHRSAKYFADTLDAPTYGTCQVRITKGTKTGLISPAKETRGKIARAVLSFYKFYEGGIPYNGKVFFPNPLPKDQYTLLLKWHDKYPITKQERKINAILAKAWRSKADSIGRRLARKICKKSDNESACLKIEYVTQSRRVADQDFRNPMLIEKKNE